MPSLHWSPALVICAYTLVAPPSLFGQPPKIVDETLRQLEKDIAKVRGLEFKSPVVAKMIKREKGSGKGVQGYYDTKEKALYLYDDIQGNYERGVLIHEMVHALQDQHFGLAKLHQTTFGSDAELAMAALIEGDATFTMIELLKNDQPKVAMMLDTTLEKSKNLRNAFLYGIGAQYVRNLKEKGGWASVNFKYRLPPRTTASILNPVLSAIDLGPGKSVGAFGIIEKLGDNPESRSLAIQAVKGLLADRTIDEGATKAWQLAFDTDELAQRFAQAYGAFRSKQLADAKAIESPKWLNLWNSKDGSFAVSVRGGRVIAVEAPRELDVRAALDRLETLKLQIHSAKDKKSLTFGELTDRLLDADLICIGESHDSELCHRVQLQIIKGIHASDARLGVGMEMFQRPFQDALDAFAAGTISEEEMLKKSEYKSRWGFHWSLYQPIVDFCKRNQVPLAALNLSKELTAKISKGGYKSLSDEDKKLLGKIDYHVKPHRDHWYETLAKMHGNTKVSEDQKERSYQVMTTWDEYMADSAARFQQDRHVRRMVVLAGSGHIDLGFGIPQRAAQRTGGKAVTIHIAIGGDSAKLLANPPADYVIQVR